MKKTSKVCSRCKHDLPHKAFSLSLGTKDGLQTMCKTCHSTDKLMRRYGITLEEYKRIIQDQGNKCAICADAIYNKDDSNGRQSTAYVDHCHSSDKIRGLLCHKCNIGLGMFKDTPEILEKAIEYVKRDTDLRCRDNGDTEPECGQDTHDRDEGHPKWTQEELFLSVELGGARE